MPTDLTGTPTSLGIGTYNVDVDAPSGLGFNEAMAQIDALLQSMLKTPSGIATGEVPVWNGSAWARSSITGMSPSGLSGYPSDANKVLRGDGSWGKPEIYLASAKKENAVTNAGGNFAAGSDVLTSALSFTADGASDYLFELYAPAATHTQATSMTITCNFDGADNGIMWFQSLDTAGHFAGVGLLQHVLLAPSAGVHTVNARIFSGAGTTFTLEGGAGGAGAWSPIFGTVRRA